MNATEVGRGAAPPAATTSAPRPTSALNAGRPQQKRAASGEGRRAGCSHSAASMKSSTPADARQIAMMKPVVGDRLAPGAVAPLGWTAGNSDAVLPPPRGVTLIIERPSNPSTNGRERTGDD